MVISRNKDIKDYIKKSGVQFWRVAERLGMADTSFSRILRYELSNERKQEIYKAVDDLADEMTTGE